MEHIVQFGVTIDDDAISKAIIDNAEKQIVKKIEVDVRKNIFETYRWGGSSEALADVGRIVVEKWLDDNKDEIIEQAAKYVAEKVYRSKAWKAKYGEVTEE